eukprot:1266933-Rhodomonas_salina.1
MTKDYGTTPPTPIRPTPIRPRLVQLDLISCVFSLGSVVAYVVCIELVVLPTPCAVPNSGIAYAEGAVPDTLLLRLHHPCVHSTGGRYLRYPPTISAVFYVYHATVGSLLPTLAPSVWCYDYLLMHLLCHVRYSRSV